MWSGARVVAAADDGTFSAVVDFQAFQFGPPKGKAEDFKSGKQRLTEMIKMSQVTMCGAIIPRSQFKQEWEIVPGNE